MRRLKYNISAVHEKLLEQNNMRVGDTSIVNPYILLQKLSHIDASKKSILSAYFQRMNEHIWCIVIKNTDENILNVI